MPNQSKTAILLLADGNIFYGQSFGKTGTTTGEICFNTGMTGYQEIFTDPSYFGQIMVTTNPHIGNYGVNVDEVESEKIMISGLVCKNFSFNHSRPNSESNLYDYFEKQNLICISDVDTRALVSYIRDNGAQNAVICTDGTSVEELKEIINLIMKNLDDAASLIESKDKMKISMIFERNRRVMICVKNATGRHLERFYQKICIAEAGPIFVDVLVNLERISDHCQVIAECIHEIDEQS